MRTRTWIAALLFMACGTSTEESRTQSPGDGGPATPPITVGLCSSSKPCPSGQFCFNGICAVGCNSNQDCAADQYCSTDWDRLCHNKVVATCPATACASLQECIGGLCSTPGTPSQSSSACDPDQAYTGNDGCDKYSVCFDADDDQGAPKCYTFSACAQDGTCPTGTEGAVCNEGIIPAKERICLAGLCKTGANCPGSWSCVRFAQNDVVGVCSNGANLTPCNLASHCTSNACVKSPSSAYSGFCSDGTPGAPCTEPSHCLSGQCNVAPGFTGICF